MKEKQRYYFEDAPIMKSIMHFSAPVVMGTLLSVIYGILNVYFIGFLDNSHMISAITLAMPIFALLMGLGNLLGVGGATYVARLLGGKQYDRVKHVSSVVNVSSMVLGVIVLLITVPFSAVISGWLGASGDTLQFTSEYLKVLLISSPVVIAFFALEQMVRAEGAPFIAMAGMLISVGVNIVLDPVLIFGADMGVQGAALATLIGNLIAVLFYVWYILRRSETLSIKLFDFKVDKEMVSEIVKIGVPAFLMSTLMGVTGLVFNLFLSGYGNVALASFGIQFRLVQVPELIVMGLCEGIIPLVAYNFVANKARMSKVVKRLLVFIVSLVGASIIVVMFWGTHIVSLFTSQTDIIHLSVYMLKVTVASLFLNGIGFLFIGMLQATGQGRASMIMAIAQGTISIPVVIVLDALFGLDGVIWSLFVAEALVSILAMVIVYRLRHRLTVNTEALIE